MPITIKKKPKTASVSSASAASTLTPSNPTQTLPEKQEQEPPVQQIPKNTPKPFIDKISIVAEPEEEISGKSILKQLDAFATGNTALTWTKAGTKTYNRAYRIAPPKLVKLKTKWPLIQLKIAGDAVQQVRIEFSPADIKASEMLHLDWVLRSFLPNGWWFFAALGRVTMIEVSVDLPLVETAFINPLPQQTTTVRTWGIGGTLETIYLGKKSGNFTRIYDRGAKRKAMGQDGVQYHATRVERVLRLNGTRAVKDLATLPNPFASLQFVSMPTAPPAEEKKDYLWHLFQDAVQLRTLPVALKLLPVEKRTQYRKWLAAHPEPWWRPDDIWQQWPNTVSIDGLDSPEMWVPLPEEMDDL